MTGNTAIRHPDSPTGIAFRAPYSVCEAGLRPSSAPYVRASFWGVPMARPPRWIASVSASLFFRAGTTFPPAIVRSTPAGVWADF